MTGPALAAEPLIRWDWIGSHGDEIWQRTVEHLTLTVAAVGIGFVISFGLALIALRWRATFTPITVVTGIMYTIPSVALFSLLVPITGLGTVTALIPLTSYTLLILVRNIVAGVDAVPPAVRDAANGMGLTGAERLRRVELPLALPTIVAGLRIASVTVIGLVTIAALVGSGGYGVLIKDGLGRAFPTPILVGGALSVVMAIVFDGIYVLVGRALTPWEHSRSTAGGSAGSGAS